MFERIVPIFDRFSSINRCIFIVFSIQRGPLIFYFHSKKYFIFYISFIIFYFIIFRLDFWATKIPSN